MQSDLSTTNSRFSAVWGRRQQVCWLWSLQQKLRTNVFISLQVIYVLVCWCSGRTTDVSSSTCSDRFQYVHRMILDAGVGLQHQELVKSRCSLLQLFPVMLRLPGLFRNNYASDDWNVPTQCDAAVQKICMWFFHMTPTHTRFTAVYLWCRGYFAETLHFTIGFGLFMFSWISICILFYPSRRLI